MTAIDSETAQITTGELSRAVTLIRGDIKDVKKDISDRPTNQDLIDVKVEVSRKASSEALGYANDRIKELQEWQKWAVRIGVPALLGVVYNVLTNVDRVLP